MSESGRNGVRVPSILAVSSDRALVEVFRVVAQLAGLGPFWAAGSMDVALRLAKEQHPSVIITDLVVPRGDGVQLLAQLKENGLLDRAIAVGRRDQFQRLGDDRAELANVERLLKPFGPDLILAALNRALQSEEQKGAEIIAIA